EAWFGVIIKAVLKSRGDVSIHAMRQSSPHRVLLVMDAKRRRASTEGVRVGLGVVGQRKGIVQQEVCFCGEDVCPAQEGTINVSFIWRNHSRVRCCCRRLLIVEGADEGKTSPRSKCEAQTIDVGIRFTGQNGSAGRKDS